MMAAPKITKTKTSQKINLKEEFGIDFSGRDALKQAMGQAIIDKVVSRTEEGKSFHGKAFAKYSKNYINSDNFKAFGKSPGEVNLTLTGDMLGSIDILNITGNTIEYGIDDSEEAAKSFNHNTGDTVRKRQFFGITKKELREIKAEFGSEIRDIVNDTSRSSDAFQNAVLNLIGRISGGDEDGS